MIKVLIVDDSQVARDFLGNIFSTYSEFEVVGAVPDGEIALETARQKQPDVITMDIHMPRMDGFEATRTIMEVQPTPIIIVTGSSTKEQLATTFHAIEAGALAVVARPRGMGHPDHHTMVREFVQTVKLMSEVKVVKRWSHLRKKNGGATAPLPTISDVQPALKNIQLVAIGASTGGPLVIQTILSLLPKDFSVPILIVQHMTKGFVEGFVEWLSQSTHFPVDVAAQGVRLLPGHAYVAPDGLQMGVDSGGQVELSNAEPEHGLCPSVSYLFRSVAHSYGTRAVGVLLSGMGKDGAHDLKLMKLKGAITIAQDEESSVVHGMPGEAINIEATQYVLSPEKIAAALTRFVRKTVRGNNE